MRVTNKLIHVHRFESGSQGQLNPVEDLWMAVHTHTGWWPEPALCAQSPLRERTFCWVEYQGKAYPIDAKDRLVLAADDMPAPISAQATLRDIVETVLQSTLESLSPSMVVWSHIQQLCHQASAMWAKRPPDQD